MNAWKRSVGTGVRKAVAILCMVCLLACFGIVRASAAGSARVTVSSCSAERDTSVAVTVRLDGNPGLWGLKLRLHYDASAMTLNGVDKGSLFSEDELSFSDSLSKNPYVVVASRGKLEDLTGDGTIVTLKFSVKADAEQKDYPVTVEIAQAVNVAGEDVSINTANGSVTVVKCLHEVKQWVTTEEAACEKTGTEVLTCKKCETTFETRSLSATNHQHTELRGAVAATQTQTGYTGDTYCTDCGKLISQGQTVEKLPAETKPAETKPAETKPAETKPAETKPAETKPAETKPTETKPTETKPAETKPEDNATAATEPVSQPQIKSGNHAKFSKNSDAPLVVVSDAEYKDFVCVEVDGATIHPQYYTVKSGSTIVTVSQDYLDTLEAGQHTLSIVSKTGTAAASFTIEEAVGESKVPETVVPEEPGTVPENTEPETAQSSGIGTIVLIAVAIVCVLGAAGLVTAFVIKKRRG